MVELLVVMALIGLLGGFVASIYLFSEEMILEWVRNLRLQNEIHTVADGIAEDIYRAELHRQIGENYLELGLPGDISRVYRLEGKKLLRNGRNLVNDAIEAVSLEFKWNNPERRTGASISPEEVTLIRFELSLTDRRDTLTLNRAVHLRRPLAWKPVGGE